MALAEPLGGWRLEEREPVPAWRIALLPDGSTIEDQRFPAFNISYARLPRGAWISAAPRQRLWKGRHERGHSLLLVPESPDAYFQLTALVRHAVSIARIPNVDEGEMEHGRRFVLGPGLDLSIATDQAPRLAISFEGGSNIEHVTILKGLILARLRSLGGPNPGKPNLKAVPAVPWIATQLGAAARWERRPFPGRLRKPPSWARSVRRGSPKATNDLPAPFGAPWNATPGWWASQGPLLGLERKPSVVRVLTNFAFVACMFIALGFLEIFVILADALGLDALGVLAALIALTTVPLVYWDLRALGQPRSYMALPIPSSDLLEVRERISLALADSPLEFRTEATAGTAFARWRDRREELALVLQPPDGRRPPFLLFTGVRPNSEFVAVKGAIDAALFPEPEPAEDWSRHIIVEAPSEVRGPTLLRGSR